MSNARILVVENNWQTAQELCKNISRLGFRTLGYVKSGEEALAYCRENLPDIIFMDIYLDGDITGIETVKKLQEEERNTSIIYLSEYSDENVFKEALETIPANYISKPATSSDISRSVHLALKQKVDREKAEETLMNAKYNFLFVRDKDGMR